MDPMHAGLLPFSPQADVEVRITVAKPQQPNDIEPAPAVPFRAAPMDLRGEQYRSQTIASGHGVAKGPEWRQRRPRNLSDAEVSEEGYVLDG